MASTQLTPVYMLRSRALEWRQATARECIQRACESDCMEPPVLMRYLRRAADLTAHAPVQVWLTKHTGPVQEVCICKHRCSGCLHP